MASLFGGVSCCCMRALIFPPPCLWLTVSLPCYPGFPSRRALPARRFLLVRTVLSFRSAPSARRSRTVRAIFPLCRAPFARRSRLSARFPVASCSTRSASLPIHPVSRSVPCCAFCAHRSFFRRVLLYSTNIFAPWQSARQTVTLVFSITHLCCVVACVCTL